MQQALIEKLESFGVSTKEALLYVILLKYGPKTTGELAKLLRSYRADIYLLLETLTKKRMVKQSVEKPTIYTAVAAEEALTGAMIQHTNEHRWMEENCDQVLELTHKYLSSESLEDDLKTFKEVNASIAVVNETREIDVTGITNEIYEQRVAVMKLYDSISEMHASEMATADYVHEISAKLDTLTAKIDEFMLKFEPLEPLDVGASRIDEATLNLEPLDEDASSVGKPSSEPKIRAHLKEFFEPVKEPVKVRYKEYWWQFWRPKKL